MRQVMTGLLRSEAGLNFGMIGWKKTVGVPLVAVLIQWLGAAVVPLIAFSAGLLLLPTA